MCRKVDCVGGKFILCFFSFLSLHSPVSLGFFDPLENLRSSSIVLKANNIILQKGEVGRGLVGDFPSHRQQ